MPIPAACRRRTKRCTHTTRIVHLERFWRIERFSVQEPEHASAHACLSRHPPITRSSSGGQMVGRSSDISILNSTLDLKIDYHSVSATKTSVLTDWVGRAPARFCAMAIYRLIESGSYGPDEIKAMA